VVKEQIPVIETNSIQVIKHSIEFQIYNMFNLTLVENTLAPVLVEAVVLEAAADQVTLLQVETFN